MTCVVWDPDASGECKIINMAQKQLRTTPFIYIYNHFMVCIFSKGLEIGLMLIALQNELIQTM